ncbi:MAG: WbqC family protein [PVC group bacterium]|nr:WbqC family protein [PVC group bacterium]
MIISVHQPQYLPWLGYFDKIDKSDCFVFLDTVQYKMREFQNRNKIRTKDGWIWLTVPVKTKGHFHQDISAVLIDDESDWAVEHKKSLMAWYGKAPFFRQYFPFFEDVFARRWDRLVDLNIYIIKYLLQELQIDTPLYFESEVGTTQKSTARIVEICQKLKADTYLSGTGGKDYMDEGLFVQTGIGLQYQHFNHPCYNQQFISAQHPFTPYMSVLDLLFNEGPRSIDIIKETNHL